MTQPSLSSRTATRVVTEIGIPASEVVDLGGGVVLAPVSYDPAIRAHFGAQQQYIRWLDNGYRALFVPTDPDGGGVWRLGRGGSVSSRPADALFWTRRVEPFPFGEDVGSGYQVGMTAVKGHGTVTRLGRTDQATGELIDDTEWSFLSSHATGSYAQMQVFGTPVGEGVLASVSKSDAVYNGRAVNTGGVPGPSNVIRQIQWPGRKSVLRTVPTPGAPLMLISGPPVLTYGEFGLGRRFVLAAAVDVADAMTRMLDGITKAADRVKAEADISKMRARGMDFFGWVEAEVHPYRFYGPTEASWSELAAMTGVRDGLDLGALNGRLAAMVGARVYGTISMRDELDSPVLAGVIDTTQPVVFYFYPDGTVTALNLSVPVSLVSLVETVTVLHSMGVTVVLGPYPDLDDGVASAKEASEAVLARPPLSVEELWSPEGGDKGVVGLLCIAQGMRPSSEAQLQSIRALTNPLMLERGYL